MSGLDPISLQVLSGRLRSICDEMGAVLIRSAHSPNIKERRDCSTALFDARGELVMQAEHIPVHLGSMPDAVAAILGEPQRAGQSWILNDPFAGGTHLPDITLVTPVLADGSEPAAFVASRAHHADVGGPTPGSMPADSRRLEDEGVVIAPRPLESLDDLDDLIARMRDREQRRADLRAQLAANETGCTRLLELVAGGSGGSRRSPGWPTSSTTPSGAPARGWPSCPDGSWQRVRRARGWARGRRGHPRSPSAPRSPDDELELDFSESAEQVEGNLNCPLPVTRSAALFAVRALLDPDAPASAGAHRPVRVIAPEGSILNARAARCRRCGERRDVEPGCRPGSGRARRGRRRPCSGPGDHEQRDPRRRRVHVLRDDRRRPGRVRRRRRPRRRPRRDVEHAQHARRGAGDRAADSGSRARPSAAAPGAPGAHRGGDGVVRDLEALEPMRLHAADRAASPRRRAGGRAAATAPGPEPAERRPRSPRRPPESSGPATGCGSRPPAGGVRRAGSGVGVIADPAWTCVVWQWSDLSQLLSQTWQTGLRLVSCVVSVGARRQHGEKGPKSPNPPSKTFPRPLF